MDVPPNDPFFTDASLASNDPADRLSDQELLRLLARGDQLPLYTLYDRYAVGMRARAYFVTRNEQLSSDTVHYTFIRLLRLGKKMKSIDDLKKWLNAAARKEATLLMEEPPYPGETFEERAARRFR
ncbi:hypothetical protein GA0116948_11045 [Chitinophaga costaii]|uniref:RNA polymerase sigma-70 factor, ECF subfamily n=1 Tax=Chitinophaga costaii TaxID=1335309 RepID=A0A1C4EVY4_9BACT|nr:hypothetical protein [Chitinophaga costaii]PUZ21615.1 hypothetical protein DCM91_16410 [Chitinophaga costaii]SCC47730.1 hypothetical protein GA0116948_11045 [Chitinophaga costaii]